MIVTTRHSIAVVLICLALCAQPSGAASPDCSGGTPLCGPNCLLVVCDKLNAEASLEELASLSHYDTVRGTSLADLYEAARVKRLEAVAMKLSAEQLACLKCPAIAHFWDNHFMVVEADVTGRLRITDPPLEPRPISIEEFKRAYSGFALLCSKDRDLFPAPKDEGADLRMDAYAWDFGVIEDGPNHRHTFMCRNAGNEDLIISRVETTCGCTVAVASADRIAPGGKGEIVVSLDSSGRIGSQHQTVFIQSNDPITPTVELQVAGIVRPAQLLFSPRSIVFGGLRKGQSESREILIPKSDVRKIKVEKVSSDSPLISTQVAEKKDESGYVVSVKLSPGAPLGELKGKVTICTNHPKDPTVEVPVSATVKGDIDVFPDTLFFGMLKKGEGGRKKITLSNMGQQPLSIKEIDNPLPEYLLVRATPVDGGKGYEVTATLKRDTPPGYIKKDVVIHTNNPDQPEIRVPVYALVED